MPDDLIRTIQTLIRIPSVNPSYAPSSDGEVHIVEELTKWATQNNFKWQLQEVLPGRHNLLISLTNESERPHLLLNGHTDTVATDAMTIDPFDPIVKEGRIWGRGSTDMKGSITCMLHALLQLRKQHKTWKGKVTLSLVVDEEAHFKGVLKLMENPGDYDFAIVGEPTQFKVIRGCKGCMRFWIRAHGTAAHSSAPHMGKNAIRAMAHAVISLEKYFTEVLGTFKHPDFGISTGSVGLIRGGTGVNIVPEFCEISVDLRILPDQNTKILYDEIQTLVKQADPSVDWEFDPNPLIDPAFILDQNHPLVVKTCNAVDEVSSPVVSFSCDASKIARAGIPCIIFGPGDIAQAHTADESIQISALKKGVEHYVNIIQALLEP